LGLILLSRPDDRLYLERYCGSVWEFWNELNKNLVQLGHNFLVSAIKSGQDRTKWAGIFGTGLYTAGS